MKWLNQLRRGSNLLLILVILYGLICGRLGKSGSFYWVVFGAVLAQTLAQGVRTQRPELLRGGRRYAEGLR